MDERTRIENKIDELRKDIRKKQARKKKFERAINYARDLNSKISSITSSAASTIDSIERCYNVRGKGLGTETVETAQGDLENILNLCGGIISSISDEIKTIDREINSINELISDYEEELSRCEE